MSISLQRQTIKVCLANASALFSNSYIYFFLFHKVRNEYRETKLFFKLAKKKKHVVESRAREMNQHFLMTGCFSLV